MLKILLLVMIIRETDKLMERKINIFNKKTKYKLYF